MSKNQTRQNQKGYPKGSMAETLRRQQIAERRAKSARRVRGALAAVTLAATGAFIADGVMEMDQNHKQSVAVEAAREAINSGRANQVDANTNVYLREGVVVRTEPKVIDGHAAGERGNELMSVGKEVLVISNPVSLENEEGSKFFMFTLEDGRVGYVSKEVLGQEDEDGDRYGFVAPQQKPELPEGLSAGNLDFDEDNGMFSIDGQPVSTARTMTPEQAFEDLA